MTQPRILILIPAYNEAVSIAQVIERARHQLPGADVLVINDGSSDDTGALAEAAGAYVLHLHYNVGIGAGVQTGFRFAAMQGYDIVIRNDGDGQHDAQEMQAMLKALDSSGVDMVIGSRYVEDRGYRGSSMRRLGSLILAQLISGIIRQAVTDPTSGFIACNRRAILLCAQVYPHDYPEPESIVILHRAGLRLTEIPVTMHDRAGGVSSITALRSAYYMVKVILAILVGLLRPPPLLEQAG